MSRSLLDPARSGVGPLGPAVLVLVLVLGLGTATAGASVVPAPVRSMPVKNVAV